MSDFKHVRSIYGRDGENETAKERYHHISDGAVNSLIKSWHEKQPERDWLVASPSRLLTCPRVVWLHNQGVKPTNEMGWGVKQRLLLGRLAENLFAKQFEDEKKLVHHWPDSSGDNTEPFELGEGLDKLVGTPDFLLLVPQTSELRANYFREVKPLRDNEVILEVAVSDSKTSRSDSFGYVPITAPEIFNEWNYYKMRIQITAYFMLLQANKVTESGKDFVVTDKLGTKAPFPELCHVFLYALDDGVVRREETWQPTKEDMETVRKMTRRFNEAVIAKECPDCTCRESYDEFDVKFCPFSISIPGKKVAEECCSDELIPESIKLTKEKDND